DPRPQDPHVRAGRGRDGGDPRGLADAGFVRGRGVPALDRVERATRAEAAVQRAGAAPGHRAQALPAAARQPEHAVPRRERGRGGALVTTTTKRRPAARPGVGPPIRNGAREARANGKAGNGGTNGKHASLPEVPRGETAAESPDWRRFVG